MKKEKILFLATEISNNGGIENFSSYFLETLLANGKKEITSIIMNNSDIPEVEIPEGEFRCVFCGNKFRIFSKIKFILTFLFYSFLRKPEMIICNHINMAFLPFIKSKISGTPYAVITYGIEVWDIKSSLKKQSLRNATVIAAFSNYTLGKLQDNLNIKNEILLFPPTTDFEKFSIRKKPKNLISKYRINENTKVILTVSRLSSSEGYKGYDKVIEALPKVLSEEKNVKYLLIGSGDEKEIERVRSLIKKYDLEENVILTGRIPNSDLNNHYNLCDIFVMPSKGEGFGIVYLEALACGKPVVAGNRDGSRDAVLDGELGLLVDPDDVDEIADAIINVLSGNVEERLLDREYLRNKVIEHYGKRKYRERLEKLLEDLK